MNIEERLSEKLRLNVRLSEKLKEKYSGNPRGYFQLLEREKEKVILGSGFAYDFFENFCTVEEIENFDLSVLGDFTKGIIHEPDLMLIVIQALRSYVDNGDMQNPKVEPLHTLYLTLKARLKGEISFEESDGFTDYLAQKSNREQIKEARLSGSICLKCGSSNVKSAGDKWHCKTCGYEFRKHRY